MQHKEKLRLRERNECKIKGDTKKENDTTKIEKGG